MPNNYQKSILIMGIIALTSCQINKSSSSESIHQDTATKILYNNLKKLVNDGKILFGQANATTITYLGGINHNDLSRSDCKDITGSHPAFIESDFMWYEQDSAFQTKDILAMKQAYERGAVLAYCWHLRGPDSQSFYARDKETNKFTADSLLVKNILSNSNRNENPSLNWLLTRLDSMVIPVFNQLSFPLIFRPFHEMNGDWFWWGRDNCTPDEYIRLFRLTIDYLREKGIRNMLVAWAPDKTADFRYYPGDAYTDIMGLDIYEPGIMHYSTHDLMIENISKMVDYADKTGKVVAITETGLRKDDDGNFRFPDIHPDFWTNYVLKPILSTKKTRRIAWIMSWYGADWRGDQSTEAYIPYLGMQRPNADKAIEDFKAFYQHPATLFNDSIPNMYHE
ncbi:MAG: hypothetical protein JXR39_08180 [Marinilabiliaceae bacterium]|nr:hypothetical protein [Marinilabiliaceae bacterium]